MYRLWFAVNEKSSFKCRDLYRDGSNGKVYGVFSITCIYANCIYTACTFPLWITLEKLVAFRHLIFRLKTRSLTRKANRIVVIAIFGPDGQICTGVVYRITFFLGTRGRRGWPEYVDR